MQKLQELLKGVRRALCRLRGHKFDQAVLVFGRGRVGLECPTCGVQSTGWVQDLPSPTLRFTGRKPDQEPPVGFLFCDGQKIPIQSISFTKAWTDHLVEQVFAALPDGVDWRGNRNVQ